LTHRLAQVKHPACSQYVLKFRSFFIAFMDGINTVDHNKKFYNKTLTKIHY
jgi:hypothetical protein